MLSMPSFNTHGRKISVILRVHWHGFTLTRNRPWESTPKRTLKHQDSQSWNLQYELTLCTQQLLLCLLEGQWRSEENFPPTSYKGGIHEHNTRFLSLPLLTLFRWDGVIFLVERCGGRNLGMQNSVQSFFSLLKLVCCRKCKFAFVPTCEGPAN